MVEAFCSAEEMDIDVADVDGEVEDGVNSGSLEIDRACSAIGRVDDVATCIDSVGWFT